MAGKMRLEQLAQDGAVEGQSTLFSGGEWKAALKANLTATAAPLVTDDSASGYEIGSFWFDGTNLKSYVCLDDSVGAAVWLEQTPGDLAYGELYSTSPPQSITVVTAGVYYQWTESIAGNEAGAPLVTVSTVNDEITIGADGGGLYNVHWDMTIAGPNNAVIDAAIHVNGVLQDDNQGRVKMSSANAEHMPSGSSLIQLSAGDVVDLRVTSSSNGHILDVSFANLHVVRMGGSIAGGGAGDTLPVADVISIAKGSIDATKQVRLEVDGLTTGTTRVVTVPDQDVTLIDTGDPRLSDARTPTAHAASHQNGGADEIATATAAANAIPKATAGGVLANGWVSEGAVTQHEGAIDHDALANFAIGEHRAINDGGTGTTELWSANKIDSEISAVVAGIDIKAGVDTTTEGLGNTTLSGEQTLNGLLTSTSRVLVTEQTSAEDNGIYVTAAGAWARAADADADAEVTNGNITHVINSGSSVYKRKYLLVTADPITVGTTGQVWEEHLDIDFGTVAGTATEGDDSRLPTQDENDALVGTGVPSSSNVFVNNDDSRLADARTPTAHGLGGAEHSADTLANLNSKVSDATLIDTGDARLGDERTANAIATTGADVNVDAAAPPTAGQVLKATSATAATWQDESGGGTQWFEADQLLNPNTADWAVNALAPLSADSNNSNLLVRLFDDTVEEGIGIGVPVPPTATSITFYFRSRAETAPAGVRTVGAKVYNLDIPDDGAVTAWSAGTVLTDIDIPTNENFQYDSQTVTLATLGLTAGEDAQIEITRVNPAGGTELVGDWAVLRIGIEFT